MRPETMARFLLRTAFYAVAAALGYVALRYLLRWLAPFLLALALSAALEPLILRAQRRLHLRRGFTAAVLTLLTLALPGAGLFWLLRALVKQATALLARLPLLLAELPAAIQHLRLRWDSFCAACPDPLRQWFGSFPRRMGDGSLSLLGDWSAALLDRLTGLVISLPDAALFCGTTALALFYTSARYPQLRAFLRRQIPPRYRGDASGVKRSVCRAMGRWLRAEALLLLITFSLLLAGLLLLRQPYALLLAGLISFVDLLPVLGTGTVLLPWAALALLTGRTPFALGLLALQLILTLQRQLLEPRLLAAQADLPPLAALLAMYLGFRVFGIGGMILFPILLLLAKQLQDAGFFRLWK